MARPVFHLLFLLNPDSSHRQQQLAARVALHLFPFLPLGLRSAVHSRVEQAVALQTVLAAAAAVVEGQQVR